MFFTFKELSRAASPCPGSVWVKYPRYYNIIVCGYVLITVSVRGVRRGEIYIIYILLFLFIRRFYIVLAVWRGR